jgi:hypothetical protein
MGAALTAWRKIIKWVLAETQLGVGNARRLAILLSAARIIAEYFCQLLE